MLTFCGLVLGFDLVGTRFICSFVSGFLSIIADGDNALGFIVWFGSCLL